MRAYNKYLEDGIDPVKHRDASNSSQFVGVSWNRSKNKWRAKCKGIYLGLYTTEKTASRAYNVEAERVGRPLNVIPPVGAAGAGAGAGGDAGGRACPKRTAPKTPAIAATGKKAKRAASKTPAAPVTNKNMML